MASDMSQDSEFQGDFDTTLRPRTRSASPTLRTSPHMFSNGTHRRPTRATAMASHSTTIPDETPSAPPAARTTTGLSVHPADNVFRSNSMLRHIHYAKDSLYPAVPTSPSPPQRPTSTSESTMKTPSISFKLKPPTMYTAGSDFKVYRKVFMNYAQHFPDLNYQRSLLLSLIDHKLFTIAEPIVNSTQSIDSILDKLQTLFSPEDEFTTKVTNFQTLKQLPGEAASQFAVRVLQKGREVHITLSDTDLEAHLVTQFIKGLQTATLRDNLQLLGPKTLKEAIAIVKRSQDEVLPTSSDAHVSAVTTQHQSVICQLCSLSGHTAATCRRFSINLRKANPNGFQRTFPEQPAARTRGPQRYTNSTNNHYGRTFPPNHSNNYAPSHRYTHNSHYQRGHTFPSPRSDVSRYYTTQQPLSSHNGPIYNARRSPDFRNHPKNE